MNKQRTPQRTNWKPLLLIPLAVVIAKGASRRRARWDAAGYGPERRHHGFGRHGFGPGHGMAEGREFRLPPKIESMLDAWHTQAHETDEASESTTV